MRMITVIAAWALGMFTCAGLWGMNHYPNRKLFPIMVGVTMTITIGWMTIEAIKDAKQKGNKP